MAADASASLNAAAARAVVQGLCAGGVRAAVLSPGARSTPLAWALADAAEAGALALHVVLDERAAAFAALGLARATGAPVALGCTSGSAGAHWLPAVIEASEAPTPLVLLTTNRPVELHGVGAPQTLDQRRLFGAFARHARDLPAPDAHTPASVWHGAALDAAQQAQRTPAGPVHLDLAFREPLWAPGPATPWAAGPSSPLALAAAGHQGAPTLAPAARAALLASLRGAQRGLIHCGPHAADGPGFGATVHALGAALGWPVIAEFGSGARLGAPAGVVTTHDALARAPELAERLRPDLVLRLGRAPHSRAVQGWLRATAPTLIGIDPAGQRQAGDLPMQAVIAAAPTALLTALVADLAAAPGGETPPAWRAAWTALDAQARRALDGAASDGVAWGGAAAYAVAQATPAGASILGASSLAFRDLDNFTPPQAPAQRAFVSRGANGIDGTLSTAVGVALGTAAPVTVLIGDLAFTHDLAGLHLLGSTQAPVTLVVVDNGGGGIFEHLPLVQAPAARFERLCLTPQALDVAGVCAGLGVPCAAVEAGALADAVASAARRGGPQVLHLRVDRAVDRVQRAAAWAAVRAEVQA